LTKILVNPRSLKSGSDHALNQLIKAGYDMIFSIHGVQPSKSDLNKLLPVSVGYLTRVLRLEHQTLLDWHDISLQPIHDFLTNCKYKVDSQ
jgi:hypothetical protein